MMKHFDAPNLLGAAAVAVMDAIGSVTDEAIGHGGETAAALVAIGHAPGLSNEGLRRVLRLSHPGTVRVVDRLLAMGMVERRTGADRRSVALHLTAAGGHTREVLLTRRQAVLERILSPLSVAQQAELSELLATVLGALPGDPLGGLSICRLCDEGRCENCPIDASIGFSV